MKEGWEDFRVAAGFLTVFPAARGLAMDPDKLGRSMALFPAVGLMIGLGLVVVNWILAPFIPRPVLDCLLILILIATTGGLHLDGIADLVDGLAGGKDRAGVLRIMKDSRVGAMGVVALIMILLLKYLSLYHIALPMKSAALIFMPAAGRWIQVVLASFLQYVRPEGGTGSAFVNHVGEREMIIATGTLILASVILFGMKGFFIILLVGLATMGLMRYFQTRLGGVTGDVLGASTEVMEVIALLLVLAAY